MDGHLLAKRIVCIAVRATNVVKAKRNFFHNLFIDLIAFAGQYMPIGMGVIGSVSSQPGSGPTFE